MPKRTFGALVCHLIPDIPHWTEYPLDIVFLDSSLEDEAVFQTFLQLLGFPQSDLTDPEEEEEEEGS